MKEFIIIIKYAMRAFNLVSSCVFLWLDCCLFFIIENGGQALVESVSGLVTVVEAGEFELEIDGEVKSPDLSSIVTDGFNTCPEGTAQTDDGFCGEFFLALLDPSDQGPIS